MKSQITLLLGILLLGVASATVYVGETINYTTTDLGLNNITDIVISNNLSIIDYTFTNETATITIPNDASVQTFTITFYGYKDEEPVVVYSGGGSSKKIIPKNITNATIINNTTINDTIDDGIVGNETSDGMNIDINSIETPEETILNKIGDFFESIWNWFKELFK